MSSSNLTRLGGLATVVGAVLFVLLDLTAPLVFNSEQPPSEGVLSLGYSLQSALALLAGPLLLLGLVCLYAHQPQAMGIFGFVAFLIAFSARC